MTQDIPTLMNASKGKTVLLRMRHGMTVQGILKDFDAHMNLTLDDAEDITGEEKEALGTVLIRGDNILAVSPPDEE
ncbi:MAG: ribonucleoprotein [Nitrosopumilus sp. D6]|nr:MAG: ribonucleoprotein [Nitrosopumilus sp. D6]